MLEICPKCKDHEWNKEVKGNEIICPSCGNTWKFKKLPLFILTGCSGVGKTTTLLKLMEEPGDFLVMDADIFYGFMKLETQEDYKKRVEGIENLSKDLMQGGKPVLWAMAGNIDKLDQVWPSSFFQEICVLALVCGEEELRDRMRNGRKITDENWIEGSVSYNQYFREHDRIGSVKFETLDISGKTPDEAAKGVRDWCRKHLKLCENNRNY